MARLERTLWDKYLARALNYTGQSMTQDGLIRRCELDIEMYGRESVTDINMKGVVGMKKKTRRRLFPTGPLGNVHYESNGLLLVKFPSLDLLEGLDGPMSLRKHHALAKHYRENSETPYPEDLPLALALQMARQITAHVEIGEDIVESVWQQCNSPFKCLSIATDLLRIEDEACKRRWKSVDLPRWEAAGLDWPALPIKRRVSKQVSKTLSRFHCILFSDEMNLLHAYRSGSPDMRTAIKAALTSDK
jgi:hypothetical protein